MTKVFQPFSCWTVWFVASIPYFHQNSIYVTIATQFSTQAHINIVFQPCGHIRPAEHESFWTTKSSSPGLSAMDTTLHSEDIEHMPWLGLSGTLCWNTSKVLYIKLYWWVPHITVYHWVNRCGALTWRTQRPLKHKNVTRLGLDSECDENGLAFRLSQKCVWA